MKQFKNKKTGESLHVYQKGNDWFVKHTYKGQWLKRVAPMGPFEQEGDALLAICMSKEIQFAKYKQVYP